jgi:hypothetical protein
VLDLSCQILLEGGASVPNAERFASAIIMNAQDPSTNELHATRIAEVLNQRCARNFSETYRDDWDKASKIHQSSVAKIKALLLTPLAPEPEVNVTAAQHMGHANSNGRPVPTRP